MRDLIELLIVFGLVSIVVFFDRRRGRRCEALLDPKQCIRCGGALAPDAKGVVPVSGYYSHTLGRACTACATRDRRIRNIVMTAVYLGIAVTVFLGWLADAHPP